MHTLDTTIVVMQKILVFLCALNIASITAYAQTATNNNDSTWDLAKCIDYAQKNNITINTLRLNAKINEQDVVAAKAARYPNLTASVTQGITNYNTGLYPASGYGVTSGATIYNGGYLRNDIKSQQLSLQQANLNIVSGENDITLSITQAYLNILLAKENIVYEQDVVTTAAAQVKQGQQRYNAGTIAQKDLLELQATLANDEYMLVNAQNTERQNLLTLKQILQLPTSNNFDVVTSDSIQPVSLVTDLASAQQIALNNRPEVKSSELGVQVEQVELAKARYSLRPSLTANGSLFTNYASSNPATKYFYAIENNFYQGLGITLSVPIFDRSITKTNVAKAKINIDIAKLDLQNTRTNLLQEIEQAYINVQNAQNQFIAAQQQLTYTKESYRIANDQLNIGVYNIVDYLQQKNLYVQALQEYTQAKYSAVLYTKIYNFYTGVPVTQ